MDQLTADYLPVALLFAHIVYDFNDGIHCHIMLTDRVIICNFFLHGLSQH